MVSFYPVVPAFSSPLGRKTVNPYRAHTTPSVGGDQFQTSTKTSRPQERLSSVLFTGAGLWSPSRRLRTLVNDAPGLADISRRKGMLISGGTLLKLADPYRKGFYDDAAQIKKWVEGHHSFDPDIYAKAIVDATEKGRIDILQVLLKNVKTLDVLEKAEPALLSAVRFKAVGSLSTKETFQVKNWMLDHLLCMNISPIRQSDDLLTAAIEESGLISTHLEKQGALPTAENESPAKAEIKSLLLNGPGAAHAYLKLPYLMRLVKGIQDWEAEG